MKLDNCVLKLPPKIILLIKTKQWFKIAKQIETMPTQLKGSSKNNKEYMKRRSREVLIFCCS
jgi:hypothetical protein